MVHDVTSVEGDLIAGKMITLKGKGMGWGGTDPLQVAQLGGEKQALMLDAHSFR